MTNKLWIVIVIASLAIIAIWVYPGITIPPVTIDGPNNTTLERTQTLYLLSSISQSLAAILGLVFTISLIVIQVFSRYSSRIRVGFSDKFTLVYMAIFVISILVPFWLLADPCVIGVKLSLTLTSICLILLIPYFIYFGQKLDPENIIQDLYKMSARQIDSNMNAEPSYVATIDNIVMTAFNTKDYDTFDKGIQTLGSVAQKAIIKTDYTHIDEEFLKNFGKQYEVKQYDTGYRVLIRLKDIGIITLDDPKTVQPLLDVLGQIGRTCISRNCLFMSSKTIEYIEHIGMTLAEKKLDTADIAVTCLHDIGQSVIDLLQTSPRSAARLVTDKIYITEIFVGINRIFVRLADNENGSIQSSIASMKKLLINMSTNYIMYFSIRLNLITLRFQCERIMESKSPYFIKDILQLIQDVISSVTTTGFQNALNQPNIVTEEEVIDELDKILCDCAFLISTIGIKAAEHGSDSLVSLSTAIIDNIFKVAISKELTLAPTYTVDGIQEIAEEVINHGNRANVYSINRDITSIGEQAAINKLASITERILENIPYRFSKIMNNDNLQGVTIRYLEDIGKSLIKHSGKVSIELAQFYITILWIIGACSMEQGNHIAREKVLDNLDIAYSTYGKRVIYSALSSAVKSLGSYPNKLQSIYLFKQHYY